ncbi:PREDICTED: B-cell receptor CD22 isoform X2 [Chinchilla lanigera]|uniref:B-cell receptor CD22 isoform X2 n=1 Tax=Chinchilla lanigera TaxID=34839 RepID=UPI00038E9DB1|nr:PREDICTED: B-cell receptor CD22 isoform X2 [Chinchilla lanigera]
MHLLGSGLLLLLWPEYLAFCASVGWTFKHPEMIYAWEGACVWIPCTFKNKENNELLDNFTLYHNPVFVEATKSFNGTVLYRKIGTEEAFSAEKRVNKAENNCTLSINPVYVKDSGRLGMRVTWKKDKEKKDEEEDKWMDYVHLNVSKTPLPPHLQLSTSRIEESQPVTATCLLNFACFGYDIQWHWSLEELNLTSPSSQNFTSLSTEKVFTQSQLTFRPQWTHHGKTLSCQVLHSSKVLSEAAVQLDVKHCPKLKVEVYPREAVVMKGEYVNMTCQVTSSNPEHKTISWLKNGVHMQEQQQPTLTLPKVTKEMQGTYLCQASNDVGLGKSEEVNVKVLYAPEPSTVQFHPSPAEEGKPVELICISPANPPAKNYTWFHNKEILENTEEKVWISRVRLEHAGNYSCLAENIYGRGEKGQGAELDVHYPPKEVTVVIQNSTLIQEGDTVKLLCRYQSSNPDVTTYSWSPENFWNGKSTKELWIYKIAWNTPPITCKACNQWCSESPSISLGVQYAPRDVKILQIGPSSEIHAGNQVLLRCTFSYSNPKEVHFFWKKNGSLLQEGSDLVFNSISPEDAGNYSCSINNSIGQTTSEIWKLQVLYAPRRLRVSFTPANSVMEGRKAALTCESDANPPVSHYSWFDWNNQDLQYDGQTLRLEPLQIKHSGSYWCRGSNRLGMGDSPPSTLTVYYSPETIARRAAIGIGSCLGIIILAIWGMKFQKQKRAQSQQELQENSSSQSFFVRNKKVRRTPLSEGPHSLGCYNPVIEDSISYATLHFPETDTPRSGDAGTTEMQGPLPNSDDMVTYSVVQTRHAGDYENVVPDLSEDDGIHYSELVRFGAGERSRAREDVDYVTLKH